MHTVHVTRTIPFPHHRAWAALDNFGGIYHFHPLVKASEITNGVATGEGTQRACHFHNGGTIQEEIIDYKIDRSYLVRITDTGPFPLKHADARLSAEPLDGGHTLVTMQMDFVPKFGLLGWLMGKTVMKAQFTKIVTSILAGLEQHLATGTVVGPKDKLATA